MPGGWLSSRPTLSLTGLILQSCGLPKLCWHSQECHTSSLSGLVSICFCLSFRSPFWSHKLSSFLIFWVGLITSTAYDDLHTAHWCQNSNIDSFQCFERVSGETTQRTPPPCVCDVQIELVGLQFKTKGSGDLISTLAQIFFQLNFSIITALD